MSKPQIALQGTMQIVAGLLVVSGLLHCLTWVFTGWTSSSTGLIPFGILYIVLGLLLYFKQYWARYFAFLIALAGGVAAYIMMGTIQLPDWVMWTFIALDLIIVILLFASIWKGRVDSGSELAETLDAAG